MATEAQVLQWARDIRDGKRLDSSQVAAVDRVTSTPGPLKTRVENIIKGRGN